MSVSQEELQEAISYLGWFYEHTDGVLPLQAKHTKTVLEALTTAQNQVSNVVKLLPLENPELIGFGYSVEAKDILEAINRENS